jgi:IMP cyclohydrolase
MTYSGRGITAGMTARENVFVGYSLTGRSPASQARRLVKKPLPDGLPGFAIETEPTNQQELEKGNPALLIYPAIIVLGDTVLASNGAQTRLLLESAKTISGESGGGGVMMLLRDAFKAPCMVGGIDITTYEPDGPNFTPRISAIVIGRQAGFHSVRCEHEGKREAYYLFDLKPGKGAVITTYEGGNEKPLLPFAREPAGVTVESDSAPAIASCLYDATRGGREAGDDFRVAVAVVILKGKGNAETAILNRCEAAGTGK